MVKNECVECNRKIQILCELSFLRSSAVANRMSDVSIRYGIYDKIKVLEKELEEIKAKEEQK